ncbi:(2Fe-2S)-binding protein [Shewanella yunxiaonensis]|nr:(2Fe-2S)-binding protein [Shewanella yunxiaonensis]
MNYQLKINGQIMQADVAQDTPLLWVLRDTLKLKGTKFGCGAAQCGACTVHLDGKPVRSCVTPISAVAGREITTIEGIAATDIGQRVQQAWKILDVPQCGYCQAGQMMSAVSLLKQFPQPTAMQIAQGMKGNLCRCATYHRIQQAIQHAAATPTREER